MGRARSAGGWTGGADAATMERYLLGEHHPQKALAPRAAFIAELDDSVIGFIAGHLTQRFGCNGELQWIYIAPDYRGTHVAAELLHRLAKWFIAQQAPRVCVNVEPDNHAARAF